MAQIVKFTYPTGKIFIGFCPDLNGDDFSGFDWATFRAELATLPVHKQVDYTVRLQVLWENDTDSSVQLLQNNVPLRSVIHEAHPELGFCMLNGCSPVLTKKKNSDGIAERLTLLERYHKWAHRLYDEVMAYYSRKDLARDDIVDAMMCLSIALAPKEERKTFPNLVIHDNEGIEMAMHMFLPAKSEI